ncbi:alpha/beta hydrolase [Actinacidiphila acidipaludis]|uniref:Alpha/beta fold hydrolase n=1 Tax=Actinacidiphila acidipaludis TaxID=2873382 RepID=A0ABS7QH00_9ACTN|nr:alpha/beta fold hydrolase [Streptomyces acidipaludis]MBY8881054.1 alpha/beta fold hydrolase [Streptomyces acidipaludis]
MQLATHTWGSPGDRVALLVHGVMADHRTWRRVGPALAGQGYHVVGVDLPGHGRSPRAAGPDGEPRYRLDDMAAALAASCPDGARIAIGHSLGALVLERALHRGLTIGRAVYSDPAWRTEPHDLSGARAYRHATREEIRAANPRWEAAAVDDEARCLELWDTATLAVLASPPGLPVSAPVPSLVLLADPSERVPPDRQEELRARGFELRTVPGTGHSIHRDDFPGFMAAMSDWV